MVSFKSALASCTSPATCCRNSEYGLWRSGNEASSLRLLSLQYISMRLESPTINFEFEGEMAEYYALVKLFLQIFQAFATGVEASGGGLNFLPPSRGESLKSRLDPFQSSLGFREGGIGRDVSLIAFYGNLYSGISGSSNTRCARNPSNR